MLSDHRVFFKEFRRTFRTTGAIAPSSAGLGKALSRYVCDGIDCDAGQDSESRRILEIGPGTGVVTRHIVRQMRPQDRLDLVEVNERFVETLQCSFDNDETLSRVAERVNIIHSGVQELPGDCHYDIAISGLPLNNFTEDDVQVIMGRIGQLLKPGGILSFFQYIAVRRLRGVFASGQEKERLRGVHRALTAALNGREVHRDGIWLNLPPAWVHHLQFS